MGKTKFTPDISLRKKNIVTGLEIGEKYIKLAQAVKGFDGKNKIIKIAIKKLEAPSEKDTISGLQEIIKQLKSPVGQLIVSIPRHKVTLRFIRIPSTNEKEIQSIVELQTLKELPFSKEEIVSDYMVSEVTGDGYSRVLIVIVHKQEIDFYLNLLRQAGLETEKITFSTEGLVLWYRRAAERVTTNNCLMLVELDADNTDIVILGNARIKFSRGISLGLSDLTENPQLEGKLSEEIIRTIEAYKRQEEGTAEIDKILVASAVGTTEGLADALGEKLGLPCEGLTLLKDIPYAKGIFPLLYESEVSLCRLIGLVLDSDERRVNLLPLALQHEQRDQARRKRFTTSLALLTGIFLLSAVIVAKKINDKNIYLSYLNAEIKNTSAQARNVEGMLKKIELFALRSKLEGSSIDILRELYRLVSPKDILLSTFIYDEENKTMGLQGASVSMSVIFEFVNQLEKSEYFKNVQLKYVSEKKANVGYLDFKIECNFEQ
ncbi:MAG: pilus assembly protein PilM [Candidatus Omnitrophota bacterium]